MSVDGFVGCAPLSLLPTLKIPEKGVSETLMAIQDQEPSEQLHQLKKQDVGTLQVAENKKAATRQKLLALNQSLGALLNLTLADAIPLVHLRPQNPTEKRFVVQDCGLKKAYLWDSLTKEVIWQTTSYEGFNRHVRLASLTDEGDVCAALQMASHGLSVLIHRDSQHKLHREQMLTQNDNSDVDLAIKEAMLILKFQKAPWNTGMFGRRIKEAQSRIHEIPHNHILLELCLSGIVSDLGMDPSSTTLDVKAVLIKHAAGALNGLHGQEHKLSRWGDFVDGMNKLRKMWHIFLFWMLFALALEGKSPFAAIAGALSSESQGDGLAILPRVLRVPWLWSVGFGQASGSNS